MDNVYSPLYLPVTNIELLASEIRKVDPEHKFFVILIDGQGGSGKTTLARTLVFRYLPYILAIKITGENPINSIISTDDWLIDREDPKRIDTEMYNWFRWKIIEDNLMSIAAAVEKGTKKLEFNNLYSHLDGHTNHVRSIDLSHKFLIIEGIYSASTDIRSILHLAKIPFVTIRLIVPENKKRINWTIRRALVKYGSRSAGEQRKLVKETEDPAWKIYLPKLGRIDIYAINTDERIRLMTEPETLELTLKLYGKPEIELLARGNNKL